MGLLVGQSVCETDQSVSYYLLLCRLLYEIYLNFRGDFLRFCRFHSQLLNSAGILRTKGFWLIRLSPTFHLYHARTCVRSTRKRQCAVTITHSEKSMKKSRYNGGERRHASVDINWHLLWKMRSYEPGSGPISVTLAVPSSASLDCTFHWSDREDGPQKRGRESCGTTKDWSKINKIQMLRLNRFIHCHLKTNV